MEIAGTTSLHVLGREKTRFKNKMMYCMEKITVEMGNVVEKMGDHVPEGLFRNHVFLPANMTVMSLHDRAAIQAIFLFALGNMGQCKILLKNKYKIYKQAFFFVTEQLN